MNKHKLAIWLAFLEYVILFLVDTVDEEFEYT